MNTAEQRGPEGTEHELLRTPAAWNRWAVAWLLAGAILRFAVAFPVHRYTADADAVGVGLCAFQVLRGETPVFYSGFRLGSLPGHITALLFMLFGASRTTLALAPVLVWCVFLPLGHLMNRELLGPRLASTALPFFAIPSAGVAFWTYMPIGYAETLLLCAATVWLAARLVRLGEERRSFFALGVVAGLGWWNNLLTVGCTGPAVAWLLWRRPRRLPTPAFVLLAGSGFVLGAFPWIAFNLRFSWLSLTADRRVQPVGGIASILDNAAFFVTYRLRELIAPLSPENGVDPAALHRLLWGPALLLTGAAALSFLLRPFFAKVRNGEPELDRSYELFLLMPAAFLILNAVSWAGAQRDSTMRYGIPLYLLVPGILAMGLHLARPRRRPLAVALTAVILAFNLAGTSLPWTERRQQWARLATEDAELVELLRRNEIAAVIGAYWTVYPINFLSREEIAAVPLKPSIDRYFRVSARLSAAVSRWALVAYQLPVVEEWSASAGLDGSRYQVGRYVVYIPRPELYAAESAEAFRDRMRQAYSVGPASRRPGLSR